LRGAGGLLDRYVLRRFAGAYGLCLFGFLLLFLVVDFFSRLDDFLAAEKAITRAGLGFWPLIGEYYLTKLPFIVTMTGPYLTLFAAIATLMTFGRHNELTPMIAAGRSHHRVLAPVYAFAVFVVFALVACEEHVLPAAMKRHAVLDEIVDSGGRTTARRPPHIRDVTTGNVLVAEKWAAPERRLVGVRAGMYHDPSGAIPDGVLEAPVLEYRINTKTHEVGWFPREGGTLTPSIPGGGGVLPDVFRLQPDKAIAFGVQPAEVDLLAEAGEPGLTRPELQKLVARYPQKFDLQMQLLTRTTRPISSLVLLLLGLPFVTRPGQKTIAAGLGIALGTCAVYTSVDFLCQQVGNRGTLVAPLQAAWFAPSLFGAIGLARIDRVAT
jgi:lipopolysaccharide export LptBFGC system permease protein LptF